jgi:hypothetical protein
MPIMSAYPPTQDVMPGAAGAAPAPMQGGVPKATTAAEIGTNPLIQSLRIIGAGIQSAQVQKNPQAAAMATAFSGLLQAMSGQGAQAPAAPQAAPVQPPAAPMPQATPTPAPAPAPAPAAQPAPAMGQMPQRPMGQAPGARPFGAPQAGQRPVSKQPVII